MPHPAPIYRRAIVLPCGGLKQLDRVAGGVVEQDLLAAGAADDVVAEVHAFAAEALDLGCYVIDDEVNAVPAAGRRLRAVGHRPAGRALRAAEEQPQVAAEYI